MLIVMEFTHFLRVIVVLPFLQINEKIRVGMSL
nr:MAG TPA: hypothetical protein [Caudoviricetes sp.]